MNEIIEIEDGIIGVIASNTGNLFLFNSIFYDKVQGHRWAENNKGYISYTKNKVTVWGHHMPFDGMYLKGHDVDHIDGNKNNCTSKNLRVVSKTANQFNADKATNTSGYTGVHKINTSWVADIRQNKKKTYLCSFPMNQELSKEKAALVYLLAKIELGYGEFFTSKQSENYQHLISLLELAVQDELKETARRRLQAC